MFRRSTNRSRIVATNIMTTNSLDRKSTYPGNHDHVAPQMFKTMVTRVTRLAPIYYISLVPFEVKKSLFWSIWFVKYFVVEV